MNVSRPFFTEKEIEEIKTLFKESGSWASIARRFKMPYQTFYGRIVVAKIISGERKRDNFKKEKKNIKTYAEIVKEKGIDLRKYKKMQSWGGDIKYKKKAPKKSELSTSYLGQA